ncbi:fucolectin-1-like [Triplophysa rosa]|uniref:fucolectin-1-like n=1 Tax=Triplophysa rosa TaxID=992332 RepID=UPI0025463280|nr:fucolectin-1-like [Triplophysa rosa]
MFLLFSRDMDNLIHLILLSGLVSVPGSLAENLAFKGTATQSSTYSTWAAQRAIDGVKSAPYCSHTSIYSSPWWRLDLLDYYDISTVVITARSDCCLTETSGAEIRIGNSLENNGNNNPVCAVTSNFLLGQTISFSCHGMKGRYVNVVRFGSTSILALCEVEVYEVLPYRQKTFLRLKFSSSGDEAAESDEILHQLRSALASHMSDFHLSWTQLPKKEKQQEEQRFLC